MDNIEQDSRSFLSPCWMEFPETPYFTLFLHPSQARQRRFDSDQSKMNGTLL
jgi:hypothetical protein